MNDRERKQWRQTFRHSWRILNKQHKTAIPLTPELAQAAAQLRDKGNRPAATAAGLYWGTRDAMEGRS